MKRSGTTIIDGIKNRFTLLKNRYKKSVSSVNIKQAVSKLLYVLRRNTLKTQNLEFMFDNTGSVNAGERKFAMEQIDVIQKCQTAQILCEEMSKKFKDKDEPFSETMELWIELKKDENIALALDVCNIPHETLERIDFAGINSENRQRKINSGACFEIAQKAREYKRQYKKAFAEYVKIVKNGVMVYNTLQDILNTLETIHNDERLIGPKGAFKPVKKICDTSIKKCKNVTANRAKLINLFAGALYNFRGYEGQAISYEHPYDETPSDGFYCELNI